MVVTSLNTYNMTLQKYSIQTPKLSDVKIGKFSENSKNLIKCIIKLPARPTDQAGVISNNLQICES